MLRVAKKMSDPGTLEFLAKAAAFPAGLDLANSKRVGPFGMLSAGFDPEVKDGLGVMMAQPSMLPTFALVVALAAIVYLFAYGLERHQRRGVPVVLEPPAGTVGQELAENREIEGRVFAPREGGWREVGSAGATPTLVVDLSTPEDAARWLELHPELERLGRELEGRVVLRLEDEWVEVILPARDSPD